MTEQEIENFIVYLDNKTRDCCVFPEQQTWECLDGDCYICRVAFFNQVRNDLKNLEA